MSATLEILVPGEPVGKQRPRMPKVTATMVGKAPRPYTPKKTRHYEKLISDRAQYAVHRARWTWSPEDRFAVIVKIFRTHVDAGPDIDNVTKAVLDALNKVAWSDDRHVWAFAVALRPRDPKNPRLEIEVRRFHKDDA